MRPRCHTVYNKEIKNVEETLLAGQNLEKFCKDVLEKDDFSTVVRPKFRGDAKKYPSDSHNLKSNFNLHLGNHAYFTDKAVLSKGVGGNRAAIPQEQKAQMSLTSFLSQYVTENDLNTIELYHMLDIDYEKLDELTNKSREFVDATSHHQEGENIQDNHDNGEDSAEVTMFFNEKFQELRANDINIQIFVQNLDQVSGITYEKNGTRIYFKQ